MASKKDGSEKTPTTGDTSKASSRGADDTRDKLAQKPREFEPINIEKHRQLAGNQREIFERVNANPEASALFLINPALALKELGVTLSPEMTHHVLSAARHPPAVLKRRQELEESLKETLKEEPQPNNPQWVSDLLFKRLKLQPLNTANQEPKYLEPLNAPILRHLQEKRPKLRRAAPGRRPLKGTVLGVATWRPAVRRLDLNAKLPQLETLQQAPSAITLEELYFYKDSHPTARVVLELGIIQRRGFPVHSADSFRKIRKGEKKNAFHTWIKQVRFSEKPKKRS